jgi:hypothetical protein
MHDIGFNDCREFKLNIVKLFENKPECVKHAQKKYNMKQAKRIYLGFRSFLSNEFVNFSSVRLEESLLHNVNDRELENNSRHKPSLQEKNLKSHKYPALATSYTEQVFMLSLLRSSQVRN